MSIFTRERTPAIKAGVRLQIFFPIESARLAALLGVAADLWPGCFSGVESYGVIVGDVPLGKDPIPAAQAVLELLAPSRPKGTRWGEQG